MHVLIGARSLAHAVVRAHPEFSCPCRTLNRAGLGPGKLRRLGDDSVEHGLRSRVELTAWQTSPSARSSSTDRASSRVRACTSSNRRTFSIAITAWSAKVVDQLDLLVGEGPYRLARQIDDADRRPFPQHRHAQHGPDRRHLRRLQDSEFRIRQHVVDMDGSTFQHGAADDRAPPGWNWMSCPCRLCARPHNRSSRAFDRLRPRAIDRRHDPPRTSRAADSTNVSSTTCRSKVDRLMTLRTSAVAVCCCNDSEVVGALAQLVEQAGVLDSDDRLAGEVRTSSICFSVKRAGLPARKITMAPTSCFSSHHRHKQDRPRCRRPGNCGSHGQAGSGEYSTSGMSQILRSRDGDASACNARDCRERGPVLAATARRSGRRVLRRQRAKHLILVQNKLPNVAVQKQHRILQRWPRIRARDRWASC